MTNSYYNNDNPLVPGTLAKAVDLNTDRDRLEVAFNMLPEPSWFDTWYLGAKTTDPTTDNDGGALSAGFLYFNTSSGNMRVYDGSAWVVAYSYTTPNPFDELNILAQIQSVALSF